MDVRLNQVHRTVRNIKSAISPFATGNTSLRSVLVYINQRYQGVREGVDFVSKAQWFLILNSALLDPPGIELIPGIGMC